MDFIADADLDKNVACLKLALEAGAPANDCRLGGDRTSGMRFSAVLMKRDASGRFLLGLVEPATGYVYCIDKDVREESIIAEWRALARRLGLGLSVETAQGQVVVIEGRAGAAPRRRGSNVARRRCRFAASRTIGSAAPMAANGA
jgi:hypothetical protein